MKIPIADLKANKDLSLQFDTPDEALLWDLYEGGRIEVDFRYRRVEDGFLVMDLYRVEGVRPLRPKS